MKIQNLKPYIIEESDGTLECYDNKNTITIKKNEYSISCEPNVYYKIESLNRILYTEYLKVKVKDKYVYLLSYADNNNEEIYVSLTYWQYIKFNFMHCGNIFKNICKVVFNGIKWFLK
jgi:hypothetical protein